MTDVMKTVDALIEARQEQFEPKQNQQMAPTTGNFLAVISKAALDPNVDVQKMHGLLDVQERMMNKQAEIDFNADFARLQEGLPRITKDAKIIHSGKTISTYATFEHIDETIRPLLIKHGFGLRFNSETIDKSIIITCIMSHKAGHSIVGKTPPLTIDSSGAKNNVQGVGSTIAYGKRYLVGMMLNLVFEGEDDDGVAAGHTPVTDEQAAEIKDLIRETGTDTVKFLNTMTGTKTVDDIALKDFDRVVNALKAKRAKGAA